MIFWGAITLICWIGTLFYMPDLRRDFFEGAADKPMHERVGLWIVYAIVCLTASLLYTGFAMWGVKQWPH